MMVSKMKRSYQKLPVTWLTGMMSALIMQDRVLHGDARTLMRTLSSPCARRRPPRQSAGKVVDVGARRIRTGHDLENPSTTVDAELAGLQLHQRVRGPRPIGATVKWSAKNLPTHPARARP